MMHEARREREDSREIREILLDVRTLLKELRRPTPTAVVFKEITMLPIVAGNTLVFTGTIAPSGAVFPPGTTFTVTANDPAITPTVDGTGLIVTVPLPAGWVEETDAPLGVSWSTSTFVPNPSTAPATLSAVVIGPQPEAALTPTSVVFEQTT
jgi:hypothetical protein